jgi:Ran GTPase-activating protein (RanGAP) involved in mRNA processing and transport
LLFVVANIILGSGKAARAVAPIITMSTPEELKQSLIAKCEKLRRNDPSATSLDLKNYGKLEWDDASHIAGALANNTRVRELVLSFCGQHLSSDGMNSSVPLLPFLSSSPSLQSLVVTRDRTAPAIKYSHNTVYILQAISNNKLLVKLELDSLVYAKPSLIEEFLAKTLTLEELKVTEGHRSDSEVYHAFRRGFEQNNSMKSLEWGSRGPYPDLGEVFFGISNHPKLNSLLLNVNLTGLSSQALRSCLHANGTLESLSLHLRPSGDTNEENEYSTLEPVLLGLACNRGVTHFHIRRSPLSNISCATAWVELLQKNTSIKILELSYCSIGRDDMSAIARGLEGNASLEKLTFRNLQGDSILQGPAWQAMLQRNRSLKEIVLSRGFTSPLIPIGEFVCFAGGLVQNASLKSLDLDNQCIGNTSIAALLEALESNDTLESLLLDCSEIKGPEGAVAVQNLWRNKTLKHLTLSCNFFEEDGAATGFPTDLSRNCVFETLDLHGVGLGSHGCRAVFESLQGNSCLRELDLFENHTSLDVDCATALKDLLGSTTLRVLKICENRVTNEGIEVLARGLHGNSSLRELDLQCCEIGDEGLLKLGEALVENSTLEILRLSAAFGQDRISQFFQLLPQMEGLKELCLDHCDGMNDAELCVVVVDGLRKNTGLQRLTCEGGETTWHDEAPSHIKPLIAFNLDLNRKGRRLLEPPLASRVPVGLWPRILANMSSPKDTSLLYYFLRKKPTFGVE